ncbi:MAG: acyltransferase [Muribaculaceae bacterium]|nr:acyltransferase [Muribaculaceae bacterium]
MYENNQSSVIDTSTTELRPDGTYLQSRDKGVASIYILKALGAFFVVCIHCRLDSRILYPVIHTAVPFFFMISGYFLFTPDKEGAIDRCVRSLSRIFRITIYANLFYYIAFYLPEDMLPLKSLREIVAFITIGDGLGTHLWYLNAYVDTLILVILSLRVDRLKWLWWCIPLFLLFGLAAGTYQFLFSFLPNKLTLSRNFLTTGVTCFGIGGLMRQHGAALLRRVKSPALLTCLLLILSVAETFLIMRGGHLLKGDYIITTMPLSALMLLTAVKYPNWGRGSVADSIGRKYSLDTYIFHLFVLQMIAAVNFQYLDIQQGIFRIIFAPATYLLTIVFVYIWQKFPRFGPDF